MVLTSQIEGVYLYASNAVTHKQPEHIMNNANIVKLEEEMNEANAEANVYRKALAKAKMQAHVVGRKYYRAKRREAGPMVAAKAEGPIVGRMVAVKEVNELFSQYIVKRTWVITCYKRTLEYVGKENRAREAYYRAAERAALKVVRENCKNLEDKRCEVAGGLADEEEDGALTQARLDALPRIKDAIKNNYEIMQLVINRKLSVDEIKGVISNVRPDARENPCTTEERALFERTLAMTGL